jgi:hypothetical protein
MPNIWNKKIEINFLGEERIRKVPVEEGYANIPAPKGYKISSVSVFRGGEITIHVTKKENL